MSTRRRNRKRGGDPLAPQGTRNRVLKALGMTSQSSKDQFRGPPSEEEGKKVREQEEAPFMQAQSERSQELAKVEKNVGRRVASATGKLGLPFLPKPFRDAFEGEDKAKYSSLKDEHEKKEQARYDSWMKAKMKRAEKGLPTSVAGRRKTRRRKSRRRR
jgi:hypothetical protein